MPWGGAAGLPPAEVKRLNTVFTKAFTSPDVLEAMKKQGNTINPGTPEVAAKFFQSDAARYAALVKKANVTL